MLGVEIDVSSRMGQNEIPTYFGVMNTVTCQWEFVVIRDVQESRCQEKEILRGAEVINQDINPKIYQDFTINSRS